MSPFLLLLPPPSAASSTLSLHDALPIWVWSQSPPVIHSPGLRVRAYSRRRRTNSWGVAAFRKSTDASWNPPPMKCVWRSEEHTSELQSHHDLVCRLLLEKKKKGNRITEK